MEIQMNKNDMRQRINVIPNKSKLWQQRLWAAVLVLLAAWGSNTPFVAQANTNMPKPVIEAAVDKQVMEQWGIELLGVRWSAAGYHLMTQNPFPIGSSNSGPFVFSHTKPGEILLQQAVHEDVAAADFAQEDELGGMIEKAGIAPRHAVLPAQQAA